MLKHQRLLYRQTVINRFLLHDAKKIRNNFTKKTQKPTLNSPLKTA